MKKIIFSLLLAGVLGIMFVFCGCSNFMLLDSDSINTTTAADKDYSFEIVSGKHHVEIVIKDYGTVSVELDADSAPITVSNFLNLCNENFYDGLTFHRILSGYMMQGGDPEGTGYGGSDETIKGEFSNNGVANTLKHTRGAISMARTNSPDSASSQFFICQEAVPDWDGSYAVFGYVTDGLDIVDAICNNTPVQDSNGTVAADDQPVIETIKVID